MDTMSVLKITMGHNSIKTVDRVMVLFSAHNLITLNICSKFCENTLNGYRVMEWI